METLTFLEKYLIVILFLVLFVGYFCYLIVRSIFRFTGGGMWGPRPYPYSETGSGDGGSGSSSVFVILMAIGLLVMIPKFLFEGNTIMSQTEPPGQLEKNNPADGNNLIIWKDVPEKQKQKYDRWSNKKKPKKINKQSLILPIRSAKKHPSIRKKKPNYRAPKRALFYLQISSGTERERTIRSASEKAKQLKEENVSLFVGQQTNGSAFKILVGPFVSEEDCRSFKKNVLPKRYSSAFPVSSKSLVYVHEVQNTMME